MKWVALILVAGFAAGASLDSGLQQAADIFIAVILAGVFFSYERG